MAKTSGGLGAIPSGLLRPTTQAQDEVQDDANALQDEGENDNEGRGDDSGDGGSDGRPTIKTTRSRRKAPVGKTKSRNLHLTDDIHDRLWLLARQRRTTVSAVANELLDKALPRWELKRQS